MYDDTDLLKKIQAVGWDEIVRVPELGSCWEWRGSKAGKGYASVYWRGMNFVVTRVLLGLHRQHDQVARHRCDNKPCVRPEHLERGTYADNIRDWHRRGRSDLQERRLVVAE